MMHVTTTHVAWRCVQGRQIVMSFQSQIFILLFFDPITALFLSQPSSCDRHYLGWCERGVVCRKTEKDGKRDSKRTGFRERDKGRGLGGGTKNGV